MIGKNGPFLQKVEGEVRKTGLQKKTENERERTGIWTKSIWSLKNGRDATWACGGVFQHLFRVEGNVGRGGREPPDQPIFNLKGPKKKLSSDPCAKLLYEWEGQMDRQGKNPQSQKKALANSKITQVKRVTRSKRNMRATGEAFDAGQLAKEERT